MATNTATATGTATQTATGTATQTATGTATQTATGTVTKTATATATGTDTAPSTATATGTATNTATATTPATGTVKATNTVVATNTPTRTPDEDGSITVIKVDQDGNQLAGVQFSLYEGVLLVPRNLVSIQATNGHGVVVFDDLEIGTTYTVHEVAAPRDCEPGPDRWVSSTNDHPDREVTVVNRCGDDDDELGAPGRGEGPGVDGTDLGPGMGSDVDTDDPVTAFPSAGDGPLSGQESTATFAWWTLIALAMAMAGGGLMIVRRPVTDRSP